MLKIVSYFQFIIIASHFEMILQKSIIVEATPVLQKPAFSDAGFLTVQILSQLDCFCDKTTAFQYFEHGVSCIYGCKEGHPVFNS